MKIWSCFLIIIFSFCRDSTPAQGTEILVRANQTIDFEEFHKIEIEYFQEVFRKFINKQKKTANTVTIDFKVEDETKIGFVKEVKEILKEFSDFIVLIVHPKKSDSIKVKLPPKTIEEPDLSKLRKRNLLVLTLSADNKVYQDSISPQTEIASEVKLLAKEFLKSDTSNLDLPILVRQNLPEIGNVYCASRSIIVVKSEYDTKSSFYNYIYSELRNAYQEIWEENSMIYFQESYDNLPVNRQTIIKTIHPYVLSEIN